MTINCNYKYFSYTYFHFTPLFLYEDFGQIYLLHTVTPIKIPVSSPGEFKISEIKSFIHIYIVLCVCLVCVCMCMCVCVVLLLQYIHTSGLSRDIFIDTVVVLAAKYGIKIST